MECLEPVMNLLARRKVDLPMAENKGWYSSADKGKKGTWGRPLDYWEGNLGDGY